MKLCFFFFSECVERQHPWSRLQTLALNTGGLVVARKHWMWVFIMLITAGSVAHPFCFSLSAPQGFSIRLPGGIASLQGFHEAFVSFMLLFILCFRNRDVPALRVLTIVTFYELPFSTLHYLSVALMMMLSPQPWKWVIWTPQDGTRVKPSSMTLFETQKNWLQSYPEDLWVMDDLWGRGLHILSWSGVFWPWVIGFRLFSNTVSIQVVH